MTPTLAWQWCRLSRMVQAIRKKPAEAQTAPWVRYPASSAAKPWQAHGAAPFPSPVILVPP